MSDSSQMFQGPPPSPEFLAQSRVKQFEAGTLTPMILATIFVLGRFYSRAVILRTWKIDDTLVLIAWAFAASNVGINFGLIKHGAGRHIQLASMSDATMELKLSYAVRIVYQLSLTFTKLAVCFFYLRVFPGKKSRYICYGIMTYIVLFTIAVIIPFIFQCTPVSDAWSILPTANCPVDNYPIIIAVGTLNIIGDTALVIFVVPKIIQLKMSARQKVILLSIVTASFLVIIAAIIRVVLVSQNIKNLDTTWSYALIGVWSIVEVATGLFCASVIAIKPLMRLILPSFMSSSKHSYTGGSGSWKEKKLQKGQDIEFQAQQRFPDRDTFSPIQPTVSSQAWGHHGPPSWASHRELRDDDDYGEGYSGGKRRAGSEAEILKETAVTTESRPDSHYRPESDGSQDSEFERVIGHV